MQIWMVVFFHPICPSRDCSKAEKCRWSKLPESCARAYFSLQIIWSKRWCWTERHCYGVNAYIISPHLSPRVVALYTHHACGFVLNGHFMCACIWQIWLIICYAQLYNIKCVHLYTQGWKPRGPMKCCCSNQFQWKLSCISSKNVFWLSLPDESPR